MKIQAAGNIQHW